MRPEQQLDESKGPDLKGNDEIAGGGRSEAAAQTARDAAAGEGGGAGSALKYIPYASAGQQFTKWFNSRVSGLVNPTIPLGTKRATVVVLHDDGRLEVQVDSDGGGFEQQFVAFDASQHLEPLLMKLAASSR